MTTIQLRGEDFELHVPRNPQEWGKLTWIAEHYPLEAVRQEATRLLAVPLCTTRPRGQRCFREAKRGCSLCKRAMCGRHSIKVRSDLGGSYFVCPTCRWKSVPHLQGT